MKNNLRILSLLPAATEIVYLLGLEQYLVGVSHECDFPSQVKNLPKVSASPISNNMTSLQIDQAVKKLSHKGTGVFHIDEKILKRLKPNLILTQELCEVCAIGFNQVKKAARILDSDLKIISLEPESINDIFENILLVGESCGKSLKAREIIENLKKRLKVINSKLSTLTIKKPKVLVIEWLDPIMVVGHWVPQMVEMAGGEMLLSKRGEKSKYLSNEDIKRLNPDILVISPCGFDIDRTLKERFKINDLRLMIENKKAKTYLIDGNVYMTRPGPRIINGIEILAEILHPKLFQKSYNQKDWVSFE